MTPRALRACLATSAFLWIEGSACRRAPPAPRSSDTAGVVADGGDRAPGGAPALPSCCAGAGAVARLDGRRVIVEGVYHPVALAKRGRPGGDAADDGSATVAIETSSGASVMLGVYYTPRGRRPVDERQRFKGKRVRVTGVLHALTPSQVEDEVVLQTMIGPYLEAESIEER